ncbi:MFS transporter [Mucilaginibacter lacusdianchii]|uniref:MFS transporter n=1 Tax=Mucilaginibacter lacusdianchii TaxID=2684211 RepID=UPI00131CF4A9|nr:MFS transporter [Mucilaginibacter sp. JXJ CY 39]
MDNRSELSSYPKHILRRAVSAVFFLPGLIFASWASRIATIQQTLNLSEAQLGGVLFAIPVGLIVSIPFAGWMSSRFGGRIMAVAALLLYSTALIGLGAAPNVTILIGCLLIYGFASNTANIAVNTQAISVEKVYHKPIMASFHGMWSLAGFAGAGIGTYMIGQNIAPLYHFVIIAVVTIIGILITYNFLPDDRSSSKGPAFVLPDKTLVNLGIVAFCSLICEGAMFDWSVIYFKKVVMAQGAWMAAGYTCFMCTMALGRFVSDRFTERFGPKATLQLSGILMASGLLIAIALPNRFTAMAGFLLVGAGVSSVVPIVYSLAGKSKTMQPSMALAAVSTIGFAGFSVGPPVIGFLAGAFSLKISFLLVAFMGLCVTAISSKVRIN